MYIIISFAIILLLASCKGESLEQIQERAGKTAEAYYGLLLEGKYADFVAGMDGGDSLPTDYREQMIANAAMFVKQQTDEHKGIKAVELSHCEADTVLHAAQAFLLFKYADNTQEVVSVPLVMRNNVWYMK